MSVNLDADNDALAVSAMIRESILTADPERWLAVNYAKREARAGLAALFALDITLGGIVASTKEMMIGAMRLAWWREAIEQLGKGERAPDEPVLQALFEHGYGQSAAKAADLSLMTDGWLSLLEVEEQDDYSLTGYARHRGGRLFTQAGQLMSEQSSNKEILQLHGEGWALADFARRTGSPSGKQLALKLAEKAFSKLENEPRLSRHMRPLIILSTMARHDVKKGCEAIQPGSPMRQLKILKAGLLG